MSDAAAANGAALPGVVVEAICGGVFVVLQREVATGRAEVLPELLPEIAFIALTPLGVA